MAAKIRLFYYINHIFLFFFVLTSIYLKIIIPLIKIHCRQVKAVSLIIISSVVHRPTDRNEPFTLTLKGFYQIL